MNICNTVLTSGTRKGSVCGRSLRKNGTCIYPSHTKIEQVYTQEVMSNITSDQYDSDIEISLPSDYDSESDNESDVSDDSYISDGDEFDIPNGYESDHDDPSDIQNELRIKNCQSDIIEFDISESDMNWKENMAALQAQSRLENIKMFEQAESQFVHQFATEYKPVKQIESQVTENNSDSESESEYEHTVLPTKEYLNLNKSYSEAEKEEFRSNKYYKLASIFTNESLSKMVDGHSNHSRLLFAFKNEESFNDNIIMFMLREILSKGHSSWSDLNESFLSMNISRKVYGNNYSKQLLTTKWAQIKKIAKDLHPTEFQLWETERLANERKAKAKAIVNHDKFQHTVYQFINNLKAPKNSIVSCSDLYKQYQNSFAQPHTINTFGKILSKYGLKSKKIKTNKSYQITTESIKLWLDSYQE